MIGVPCKCSIISTVNVSAGFGISAGALGRGRRIVASGFPRAAVGLDASVYSYMLTAD